MAEVYKHIKNPLTIVAIFSCFAETGGKIVLPLLGQEAQERYAWILLIFPFYLVSIFFFILYKKHHVLYAPSDYGDEKSFERLIVPASDFEKRSKSDEEMREDVCSGVLEDGGGRWWGRSREN